MGNIAESDIVTNELVSKKAQINNSAAAYYLSPFKKMTLLGIFYISYNSLTSSVQFNDFLVHFPLGNHQHKSILEHFYHPSKIAYAILWVNSPPPFTIPILPRQSLTYFLSPQICLFWTFPINGIIQYVVSCVWYLSPTIMFLKFINIMGYIVSPFLITAQQYSTVRIYTFCSSTHQLMGLQVVSNLDLL